MLGKTSVIHLTVLHPKHRGLFDSLHPIHRDPFDNFSEVFHIFGGISSMNHLTIFRGVSILGHSLIMFRSMILTRSPPSCRYIQHDVFHMFIELSIVWLT